jgi:3-phenylpropionate/trans-cinnamate dioxygenase ferredoxin reductase subunit
VDLDQAQNLHFLRTAADVMKIKDGFEQSETKKVLIIGGGYIGLEIAASLRKLGLL